MTLSFSHSQIGSHKILGGRHAKEDLIGYFSKGEKGISCKSFKAE